MNQPPRPPQNKQVPIDACRFAADVELGDTTAEQLTGLEPVPITVRARSNQPIEHGFWGRIVHDMAGMFTAGPTIPFDYNHNTSEILGPCTEQNADPASGLIASGMLTPFQPGDRAAEVIFKGGNPDPALRVPYQASINWHGEGIELEQIGVGVSAEVNGYEFTGPGVIVRRWPLRGIAICPYGADANTETLFKEGGPTVPVHYLHKDETMPVDPKAAEAPADVEKKELAEETPAPEEKKCTCAEKELADGETEEGADPAVDPKKAPPEAKQLSPYQQEGQRFVKHFGSQGAMWHLEGKTFEEAQALFSQGQQQQLNTLTDENATLKKSLAALRGEKDPLTFSDKAGVSPEDAHKFAADDNTTKIAKLMKLPGRRK